MRKWRVGNLKAFENGAAFGTLTGQSIAVFVL
jgi:hypothetical protein